MPKWLLSVVIFLLLPVINTLAQDTHDSLPAQSIPEVTVKAYFKEQPLLTVPASVSVIDSALLRTQPSQSLVSAVNTMPGIRMEERSPGSYRLSIRGSVLRSPFGVRNVKVYMGDIMLTDGGGNTYINLLDAANTYKIEILKGPEGSIYGANTGGVILINPVQLHPDSISLNGMAEGGSYGYVHEKISFQKVFKNYLMNVSEGYQRADGYRQQSASQQYYAQLFQRWQYSERGAFEIYFLYSNVHYQTPGGLTLTQYENNPSEARPATATLPGAVAQKATVYNSSVLGAIKHEYQILPNLRYVITVTATHAEFENPGITNTEVRNENNIGARDYLEWSNKKEGSVNWQWQNGGEAQQLFSSIANYGNRLGVRDTVQANDLFDAGQYFAFTRFNMTIRHRWTIEAALSVNYYQYNYKYLYPIAADAFTRKSFNPQVMPRVAASYKITDYFAWRASVSRGYSPPTLAEIHPTDKLIDTDLQPESGWNYETGFRIHDLHERIWLDEAVFYYQLQNAIVMRQDSGGNAYFVNAGGTRQTGLESQLTLWIVKPQTHGFVRGLQLRSSYTFSHFLFHDYMNGTESYSGNHVTGVPSHTVVSSLHLAMALGFYLFLQHDYTSSIPLNDANTDVAKAYNLLQLKAGWVKTFHRTTLELFVGINNILNQRYSLGNDLNAVGGRYYNAAAPINYYGGVSVGWK